MESTGTKLLFGMACVCIGIILSVRFRVQRDDNAMYIRKMHNIVITVLQRILRTIVHHSPSIISVSAYTNLQEYFADQNLNNIIVFPGSYKYDIGGKGECLRVYIICDPIKFLVKKHVRDQKLQSALLELLKEIQELTGKNVSQITYQDQARAELLDRKCTELCGVM